MSACGAGHDLGGRPRRAGYESRAALLAELSAGTEDEVYRIELGRLRPIHALASASRQRRTRASGRNC